MTVRVVVGSDPAIAMERAQRLIDALHGGDVGVAAASVRAEVERLAAAVGSVEPGATSMEAMVLVVAHLVTQLEYDLVGMDRVAERATALRRRLAPGSLLDLLAQVIAAAQTALAAGMRGDPRTLRAQVELLTGLRDDLSHDDPAADRVRAQIDEMLDGLAALDPDRAGDARGPGGDHEARLAPLRALVARGGVPTERAMAYAELGGATMSIAEEGGPERYLDEAVDAFGEAARIGGDGDPRQVFYLAGRGGALVRRFERGHDGHDLHQAIAAMDRARVLAGDAAHPHWALLCTMHSLAHRLAGRHDVARSIGRDGLQGHAWSVLLQGDAAAATAAARHAAADATHQARWCFGGGDVEGGILALESGRGLALQAATRIADASTVLRAAGEVDLAARWDAAVRRHGVEHVATGLRRDVVRAIERAVPGGRPGAPAVADTQAALGRLGGDAVIYLVAGDGAQEQGFAVIVPARGRPSVHPLPDLAVVPGGPLDRYITESAARGTVTTRIGTDARWTAALEQLCDWAWTTAIGPLLDHHLPSHRLSPRRRAPRLTLIAMGELGVVPWHAARCATGGRVTYAVECAVFSYAVSALMLRAAARAAPVPATAGGLVVGDPDTGGTASPLLAARREALAVRDVFYPDAVYLGRTADGATAPGGPGTRRELENWLTDTRPASGTVLHAACHAVLRPGPGREPSSMLLLARGDHLAAEDLVGVPGGRGRRRLALVALSACDTGVSGRGYDEAFSLATAFLNGGAATVVSSLWALPDSATATLMFMFHHFLRSEALPPADALRAAQLWMLQPDRRIPPTMPRALRRSVQHADAADVVAWAGVNHAGS